MSSRSTTSSSATTSTRATLKASRTPRRDLPWHARTTTPTVSTRRSGGCRPTSSSGSGKGTIGRRMGPDDDGGDRGYNPPKMTPKSFSIYGARIKLKAALRAVERAHEAPPGLPCACTRRRTRGRTPGRLGRGEPSRPAHASARACCPHVCSALGFRAWPDDKATACYTARAPPKRARRTPRCRMPAGHSAAGWWTT